MQILPICHAVRNARLQNRKLASHAGRHLRVTPDHIAAAERPAAMAWGGLWALVNSCKGSL
ncbi:hypothetical protein [Aeromonas salmonicida]|uniref:hypothetical protein n=1 Tax=Aeromonas salmonicida TaxID=645 RepID=UPI000A0F57C7|nr:hypothetical protein [Aeromonas salmonicida]ORJ12003.1 hypothetical protein A7D02_13265 [Aeromonas salmonicida]ORJ17028.1 hypothetical protein A7D03_10595 [Aeromonas salmonicida]WCH32900.1 hypothetical protein ONZ67_07355 [Aeromonas salmonicida]WCH37110.1 hypothetical protein ONZ60_07420 [Aeromonas salmonicida]WGI37816.1 hypothetical protein QDU35_15705 [Aeromonas salmonicida]